MKRYALALLGLAAVPGPAVAEEYTALAVAGHPEVFRWVRMIEEAFEPAVNKALEGTGHSLSITGQYGGAIAKVGDELETVEAGLAQLGICQSVFDPAKLGVLNVTYYTPFVSDDYRTISGVMHDLQSEDERFSSPWAENGVVYIGAPVGIDDYLLMTTFPVDSLADLEGRKIAAPGPAINWLSGTGAIGVSGNLTTYYNEIQTGVYDGAIIFGSAAAPSRIYEVAPHVTFAGLGAQFAAAICANQAWYESLPAEVQEALHAGATSANDWYLDALDAGLTAGLAAMKDAGAIFATADDEFRASWSAAMDNAAQKWATQLDEAGQPGSEVLSLYMDAMRAAGAEPLRNWDQE